jgi:hypothetical protein
MGAFRDGRCTKLVIAQVIQLGGATHGKVES